MSGNIYGSLPRRYARALIQIAQEEGGAAQVETFGKNLEDVSKALEVTTGGPSFLRTLSDDTLPVSERLAAIGEISDKLGVTPIFKNFLSLLVSKERMILLSEVLREYQRFQDEILGIIRVVVATPTQPDGTLLDRVAKTLSEKMKKKVLTRGEADPSLIGGIVLRVDHTVYDGSIRTELERIKDAMMAA